MKTKTDWIVMTAAVSIGYLMYLMMTAESLILPAFFGALAVHGLVARIARTS